MNEKIPRRKFLGVGLGMVAAGLAGCDRQKRAEKPPLDERFTYDISKYEHIDPALLLFEETLTIPTGLDEPKCLAVGTGDAILVGGDRALKTFDSTGKLLGTRELTALPHAVTSGGRVVLKDRFEGSESFGDRAHLTAIVQTGDAVYVADAGNREVIRCDLNGKVVARFGKIGANDGNPGFAVPSPYFDMNVGPEGLLWIANPGKHRVEAYTLDGKYETGWGETAMNVEGFCGCCNPVYFARLPDGRFVTSEKGLNRVKIYDVKGKFEGVVAGPEQLVKDRELARRACSNCQIGYGLPVACDSRGRVILLDPATKSIRIFAPKEKKS